MSLAVSKTVDLSPAVLSSLTPESNEDGSFREYPTLGGVLSNTDYAWLANGPNLEIIKTSNSRIVGAWSFNLANNAEIICVEEVQKINKRPPLLAVCLDCGNHGSMICIFDFITSKVIRAIEVPEIITSLHVIDSGNDIFTLPSPLRAFDGILTIGTAGGPVYLIDICRQVCDDGLTLNGLADIRDESNPCKLFTITSKDIDKIELHKESAVRHNDHLAIYLNATFDNKTQHFLLKGPEGGNRTYVDAKEAAVSALFYCPQLGSLLVGYNFGAFQVYNLVGLTLIYTSPVCEEHIPITHFTIQEPADDPRAYCYIWAVYSAGRDFQACFPLAVMYTFCYQTKEYHEGYGFLYQDFNYASIQFQMELTSCNGENRREKPQGGRCLRLNTIQRGNFLRDTPNNDSIDDNLSLSIFIWNIIYNKRDSDVCVCIFDLNQWYKEQLPSIPDPNFSSTYMIQFCVSNLFNSSLSLDQDYPTLDVSIIEKSLKQFKGIQKLEEYFCPNSLSYDLVALRENSVVFLQNKGVQKSLLAHIESSGPLCLIDPAETYQQIIGLGLLPLFIDLPTNIPISTNQRREIILSSALEHYLRGWLCKCASEWASGNFLSAGCSLDFLISWAFQRASVLKTNCDKFCVPLFDYSQTKLDSNTTKLLNSCTRQLRNLTNFYVFVIEKLYKFISNPQLVQEQYKSLESIVVYLEVVLCFLNIGLLPECPIVSYPQIDDFQRINVPYPAEMLIDAYNERRGLLKIENEKLYSSSNSPLFIDNLIDSEYGSQILQGYWRDDGGNGLYPPLSIQALLRIYLIEDADIVFKHTVVSYLLLDLVTILDQDRYKHIASYLIKFPTVFKLSLSKIKIIQALWQLDHGDCNAALGLLFDSLVKKEDLTEWHHKMVLRLLILQNQHKLALLYLQVKNPIIKDNEDICAIISLYVANDMLDEAFYFEQRYSGQVGKKLFIRLLEEADKNDKLKLIIRRNLNQEQETLLLDYLTKSPKPYAKDLQIYYYIINSRHFEAFNLYNSSVTNQVDCQGLSGQLSANPQDQMIIHLKRLFPDITQKIFDYCYEHKNDVVEKETKPTPVSAFVYNAQENAKYKSNFIGAVIAKTRTTFNESALNKKFVTETIPFIRTSIISKTNARDSVTVIDPKIIKVDNSIDSLSESPPPNKRLKLSKSSSPFSTTLSMSRLETPIVQRKLFKTPESIEKSDLPQSILKKLTPNESSIKHEDSKVLNSTPLSSLRKGKSLGSPYKSLERPSPSVRFQGLKNLSPIDESQNSSKELDNSGTTCESSKSPTIQKFYSPDVSFNDNEIGANSSENMDIKNDETIKSPVFLSPKTRKSVPLRSTSSSSSKRLSDVSDSFGLNFNSSSGSTQITLSTSSLESVNSPVQDKKPVQDSSEGSSNILSSNINVDEKNLSPRKDLPRILPNLRPRAPLQSTSSSSSKRLSDFSDSFDLNLNSSSGSTKITLSRSSLQSVNSPIQDSSEGSSKIVSSKHSLNLQSNLNINVDEKNLSPRKDSPRILPNLRPRKSLCRKVLEHNIASRVLTSPRRRLSKRIEKEECSELKNIQESHLESSRKFNDGKEIQKSNLIEKYSITSKTMVEETDEEDISIHEIDISGTSVGLSDSFKRSLIDSKIISSEINENLSVSKNETEQVSEDKNTISETENQQHSKLSETVLKNNEEIQNQASIIEKTEETAEASKISLGDSKTFLEETDDSIVIKNDTTFGLTDSLKKILNDSSSSGRELEESKNPSISENRTNIPTDNETNTIIILDDTQKESKSYPDSSYNVDDNMMEVNDYNNDDAVPQTTDNKTSNDDVKDDDDDVKLIYDDLSQTSQTKQINVDETENNNDDNINIEEIILKADNQSSLVQENDLDETPSALERNVLDDDSSEDNKELNVDDPKSGKKQLEEPEVIEILSSSEEDGSVNEEETEESSSENSSSNDDGDHDENLDVVFERNINESSSVSSVSSANSITSSEEEEEENDDTKETEKESENGGIKKKRQSYGLFYGPIGETIEEKTIQESIINLDETQKLEKTGEVEDKKATINETLTIEVEEIEKNKETDSKMEQSHETDIDKTVCTDENIGKSSLEENKSVIEFKNQQLDSETEAKESNRNESHLEEEEELEIGESKEIDNKKRQSYGLFHGPIVYTTIREENIPELQDTSIKENPVVDTTISEESMNDKRNATELELNDTVIKENENRPNTDCTDENIGKTSLGENKSVIEFENKQLEHSEIEAKESNRSESHLKEEELEIGKSKEIENKKRQSYGLFHGPIVDTTIREENIPESQDSSIKENPVVDTTISEERQLELNDTVIKENENRPIVIEEQTICKDKEIEENEETVRIRRQSHGLFHGIITDKTVCEESDNSAIDHSKNQLTDTQIEEETSQEDYNKRQSYGLFHGSINETITEDRDCLTKLDISAIENIENKAIDGIQSTNIIDLPSTSQFERSEIDIPSTSNVENKKSVESQRRTRRAASEDIDQVKIQRSIRTRSSSFHSEGHQESYNSDLDNTLSKSLRSRTILIDEENNKWNQRKRSTSIDDKKDNEPLKKAKKSSKKHTSILQLPEIIEEEDEDNHTKRIKETLENYSMSRRITRRQASLLQSIDPVVVLNKLPLDETLKQIEEREQELPTSQLKPKRRLRSDSQNSNTSVHSDTKVSSTTGTKMRLRSSSTDAIEGTSTSSKYNKKTKSETSDDLIEIESGTRTRSRTNSESSTASSASTTSRVTRKKVKISKLPEIKEEDSKETATAAKRVTRKRSNQK